MDHRAGRWTLAVVALLATGCGKTPEPTAILPADSTLVGLQPNLQARTASNRFAWRLYREMARDRANFVVAPYEISRALSLFTAAARGETQERMIGALSYPPNMGGVGDGFATISHGLHTTLHPNRETILFASGVWAGEGVELSGNFKSLAERLGIPVTSVDLRARDVAAKAMNDFTSRALDHTVSLVAPRNINKKADVALTGFSTVVGPFYRTFTPQQTDTRPFWVSETDSVDIETLRQVDAFYVAPVPHGKLIDIPYLAGPMGLILLIPDERTGLTDLENAFTPDSLRAWADSVQTRHADLVIPKMEITTSGDLTETLERLGMSGVFGEDQDFGGLRGGEKTFFPSLIMGASLDFSENGSRVTERSRIASHRLEAVYSNLFLTLPADHPFAFMVVDRVTETILLIGRYTDPRA